MKQMLTAMILAAFLAGAVGAEAAKGAASMSSSERLVLISSSPYSVGPSSSKGPYYEARGYELKTRKFSRGVANIVLSPAEIPNQMLQESFKSSPVSGAFVGAFKGLGKGLKRLGIGTWETLTFYHPGANHYQPYVEPEVVFQEYLH